MALLKANEVHDFGDAERVAWYRSMGFEPACRRCWCTLTGPLDMDVSKYPPGSVGRECISEEEANGG